MRLYPTVVAGSGNTGATISGGVGTEAHIGIDPRQPLIVDTATAMTRLVAIAECAHGLSHASLADVVPTVLPAESVVAG